MRNFVLGCWIKKEKFFFKVSLSMVPKECPEDYNGLFTNFSDPFRALKNLKKIDGKFRFLIMQIISNPKLLLYAYNCLKSYFETKINQSSLLFMVGITRT